MGVGFGNEAQLSGSVSPEPVTFKGDTNKKTPYKVPRRWVTWTNEMMEGCGPSHRETRLEFQTRLPLVRWLWVVGVTSWSLSVFICKMGLVIILC